MGNAPDRERLARRSLARQGLAAAIAMALPLPAAWAQTTATLEAVMVTAQRRVENVQQVPISVTAVGGEKLTILGSGGRRHTNSCRVACRAS